MTQYPGIASTVRGVIAGTAINPDASREPRDERAAFPPDPLYRLFRAINSPDRLNAAIGECDVAIKEHIAAQNIESAFAAYSLRQRLEQPPSRPYVADADGGFRQL
jgi:hypothetical protein